jgi:hypothetical protein
VLSLYHHKEESVIGMLDHMKNGFCVENEDLIVISARIWVLLCKLSRV